VHSRALGAPLDNRTGNIPVKVTMPQYYSFEIPTEGVSREVLEADLRYYLGHDAKVVDSRVCLRENKPGLC